MDICREIVLFLIVAKILESFISDNKFGKFVKLIVSLIIVLKLIAPVFSLFNSGFEYENIVAKIEQRLEVPNIQLGRETAEEIKIAEIEEMKIEVEEIGWESSSR